MQSSQNLVRSEVVETTFNLYSDAEKKASLSVVKIQAHSSLDVNGRAIPGGLYDEHMGPLDQSSGFCQTCNLRYAFCPGHPGHIELDVPVYYPMLFPAMYQILRCKCFYCHKLRISDFKVRYYLTKLKLLEMGDIANAMALQDILSPSQQIFDEDQDLKDDKNMSLDAEQTLRNFEQRYAVFASTHSHFSNVPGAGHSGAPKQKRATDPYIKDLQAEVIETFQKAAMAIKACENCGAHTAPLRKDGYTKLFQKPMPKRLRATMTAKRMKTKSAMESLKEHGLSEYSSLPKVLTHATVALSSGHKAKRVPDITASSGSEDSDSEEEEDDSLEEGDEMDVSDNEGDGTFSDSDRYLVPIEVEAQLRLLWLKNQEILDFIWLRAMHSDDPSHKVQAALLQQQYLTSNRHSAVTNGNATPGKGRISAKPVQLESEGWKMFFTRVVLVPPNKFRPPGKVGDMVAEHPQNTHLKKVMIENNSIRDLYSGEKPQTAAQLKYAISRPAATPTASADGETEEMNLSKVVSHWIELQQALNCYMDSSKDSNVLAQQGPAGIRQILERKEGLFRRHMMGKRVNFCCRSVISPDPYIGTNEIGIPVHFAKSLHYPTPVNNWNVKYLRTLVQRGPFQYPVCHLVVYCMHKRAR